MALGSLALPAIATFGSLYFSQQRWESPALLMTSFGSAYIGVRLLGGDLLQRVGAKRVAVGCFLVETAGLVVLWLAPSASVAIAGAALSGIGMSLLYPALAVEVVARVPASSRGSALGAFSMCLDVATAVAGPICGAVATLTDDFRDAYAFSVLLCMVGLLVALRLRWSAH